MKWAVPEALSCSWDHRGMFTLKPKYGAILLCGCNPLGSHHPPSQWCYWEWEGFSRCVGQLQRWTGCLQYSAATEQQSYSKWKRILWKHKKPLPKKKSIFICSRHSCFFQNKPRSLLKAALPWVSYRAASSTEVSPDQGQQQGEGGKNAGRAQAADPGPVATQPDPCSPVAEPSLHSCHSCFPARTLGMAAPGPARHHAETTSNAEHCSCASMWRILPARFDGVLGLLQCSSLVLSPSTQGRSLVARPHGSCARLSLLLLRVLLVDLA